MRPIQLTIEGLRSFKTEPPTEIDFENRDQLAIVGDTGAGKSSILEAMTWALYGQASYSAKANQELMNDEATWMRVTFRFWAGSHVWTAIRQAERKNDGTVGPATATLEKTGDRDERLIWHEGVQQVNKATTNLLGLDVNAFLRTIVLPQGRFARLLADDEPRNRANILRQVWHTSELERGAEQVAQHLEELEHVALRAKTTLESQPEDPQSHLHELGQEATTTAKSAEEARGTEDQCRELIDQIAVKRTTYRETAAEIDGIRGIDPNLMRERSRTVNDSENELKTRRKATEQELATVATDLKKLGEAGNAEALEAADRRLQHSWKLLDTQTIAETTQGLLTKAGAANTAATKLLEKATHAKKHAERREQRARALSDKAQSETRHAETQATEASETLKTYREGYQATLRVSLERCELLTATKRRLDEQVATAAGHATQSGKAAKVATARQQELETRHAAHAAAAGLEPGDDCPVCNRELPATWTTPNPGSLAEARALVTATSEAQEADTKQLHRLQGQAENTATQAQSAATEAGHAQAAAETARARCGTILGLDPGRVNENGDAEVARREQLLNDKRQLQAKADQETANCQESTGDARQKQTRAQAQLESSEELLQRTQNELERAQANRRIWTLKCEEDGCDPKTPAAAWQEQKDHEALQQREAVTARLEITERERLAKDSLIGIERGQNDVAARRREIEETVTAALQKIDDAMRRLNPDTVQPTPEQAANKDTAAIERLETSRTEALHNAGALIGRALEKGQKLAQQLSEILRDNAIEVRSTNHQEVIRTLRQRTEDRAGVATHARKLFDQFKARLPQIERLKRTAEEVDDRVGQLKEIATALKPGGFPKWLTLRRSTDLLRHASKKLEEMSQGRYAFRDPRDTDEQWKVLDRHTGATRSPATLSGGEQFIAALALSLGMVETMGQRGGRLEAFFLDEGFGTLDSRALEVALDGLEEAATPEHLVGVITHVKQVAERIPHVLAVQRTPGAGSSARWLSEAQRLALGEGGNQESDFGLTAGR